jgi:hypothetical protein
VMNVPLFEGRLASSIEFYPYRGDYLGLGDVVLPQRPM